MKGRILPLRSGSSLSWIGSAASSHRERDSVSEADWAIGLPAAVTVTDEHGKILSMNEASRKTFEKYGGASLIGQSVFDIHPDSARETIRGMFETHRVNAYTIEKEGRRKLIYQCP